MIQCESAVSVTRELHVLASIFSAVALVFIILFPVSALLFFFNKCRFLLQHVQPTLLEVGSVDANCVADETIIVYLIVCELHIQLSEGSVGTEH